ncbi:hypothetical protein, partial [Streptomyces sp. NPDC089795]|uniref:hypothetical protein n=1 Tax=Streptomyces sp. NPDC089795 TaxID=3155297 RepID=UPI0034489A5A
RPRRREQQAGQRARPTGPTAVSDPRAADRAVEPVGARPLGSSGMAMVGPNPPGAATSPGTRLPE